jgi:hypothetical protein
VRTGRVLAAVALVVVLVAAGAARDGHRPASERAGRSARAELVELGPPATADTSNQAGWWTPIVVHRDAVYYAYDAPAATPGSHVVRVAKRLPSGLTESSCLTIDGRCATYRDDVGHHQPSLAVDGDGYVHVFVAMHLSPFHGRYFRSAEPESVTTFAEQSRMLPDQTWTHTYPVLATAPDGDVWLAIRSRSSPGSHGVGGRIYHYDTAHRAWTRAATFAYNPGLWVYPDDLQIDASGRLHIAFEWVKKRVGWFPHIGAYVTYDPATGRLANAAGQTLGGPLSVHSPATYQSWSASFDPAARGNGFGVQTAKLALDPGTGRPQIVYRYQSGYHRRPSVLAAGWDGTRWRKATVYGGRYDTFPAVDVTMVGTSLRVYYAKVNTSGGPSAFVAERTAPGTYAERSLAPTRPGIERLAAVTRADGTDVVYLSAPQARAPAAGQLYVGTLAR